MKTKIINIAKLLTTVAVGAIVVASCTKEMLCIDPEDIIIKRNIRATATMPGNADKAYIDNTTKYPYWQSGDQISVNGTALTASNIVDNYAEFGGSVTAKVSGDYDYYWAVYPASSYVNCSNANCTINIPPTQIYNSSLPLLQGYTYMVDTAKVATGTNKISFEMKNLVSVLKLTLTGKSGENNHVNRILIKATTSNKYLSGKFRLTSPTGSLTKHSTAYDCIEIICTDGANGYIDISTAKDIYVVLPPVSTSNITMNIYNTDNDCYTTSATSVTLARNTIYTSSKDNIEFLVETPVFSASASTSLIFAPGNLQWSAYGGDGRNSPTTHTTAEGTGAGTWRFAEHQWDYVGITTLGNVYHIDGDGNAVKSSNTNMANDYEGWIDLFGWGTSGWNNGNLYYQPYDYDTITVGKSVVLGQDCGFGYGPTNGSGTYNYNLTGTYENADWGMYNAIYNPKTELTDAPGTWRTPTKAECAYILNTRSKGTINGVFVRYVFATINNDTATSTSGLIIFPDNFNGSATYTGVSWGAINGYSPRTTCTAAGWRTLEKVGCVFLPLTANVRTLKTTASGNKGSYWTSTNSNSSKANVFVTFSTSSVTIAGINFKYQGRAVRLVKDN